MNHTEMAHIGRPKVKIRQAEPKDLDAICECEQTCFDDPWSVAMLYQEICENPSAVYLVLTHRGRVVGYGGMYIVLDEAHITNVCVLPEYRGMGLAHDLMHALQDIAASLGANAMTLEVAVSNKRAIRLYMSCGFAIQGVRKKYYHGKEDAYIMWTTNAGEVAKSS